MTAVARISALPVAEILRRRQIRPVFQPVIDLVDGSLAGYEALARIGPGEGGLPEDWLAAADGAGLRTEFDLLCLEVIADALDGDSEGLLFVNSSVRTVYDDRLLEMRDRLPADLVLDLRERDAIAEDDDLASRLAPLTGAGVRLAIDDGGTGSFLDLARLAPSFVKLDRRIVRGIDQDPMRQSLAAAIVRFGFDVGFDVLAECVERVEELDALREAGVRLAQGFLLGRPALVDRSQPTGRPPATRVDSDRAMAQRLRLATTPVEASQTICDALATVPGLRPSVYFERGGLLRCHAQRNLGPVLDGIPTTSGLMARGYRSGERLIVDRPAEDPDFLSTHVDVAVEVIEPLSVRGRVIGVLNVEAADPLGADTLARIHRSARLLSDRLEAVGVDTDQTALARLARSAKELSSLRDEVDIERASARLACDVSGFSSAALFLPAGPDGVVLRASQGPLTGAFRELQPKIIADLLDQVGGVSCCYASDPETGLVVEAIAALQLAGAASVAFAPVPVMGRGTGVLVIADHAPLRITTELVEAVELLARATMSALDLSTTLSDLRDRATRDAITGLHNARAFEEAIGAVGGRRVGRWALVMADIDGFKVVNDTYGHPTGDRLLRELSRSLSDVLRPMDQLFRVGGDEFAAILPDLNEEGAREVGGRLCAAAQGVLGDYGAGLSVGVALPKGQETMQEFIQRADNELYRAKRFKEGEVRVSVD